MQTISTSEVCENLDFVGLIPAISHGYHNPPTAPKRIHHQITMPAQQSDGTLLYMPAWRAGDLIGIKLVSVFPDNTHRDEVALQIWGERG